MYPEPVTAINLAGTRAADGSLKVATQADEAKLLRDEKVMADDAAPARTSDEIFQSIIEEGSGARVIDPVMKAQLEGETIARINAGDFAMDARLVVGDATNRAAVFDNHIEAVNAVLRTESFNPETLARAERGLEIWTTASNNLKKAAATQADEVKLARMEKQLADDAKLAAATQSELFSTANAATYENYSHLINAARLANEAKIANLKKTGMLDAGATESRLATRKPEYPVPSVPTRITTESRLGTRKPEYPVPSIPKARIPTESRLGTRQPTYKPPSLLRATSQVAQRLSAASQNIPDYTLPDMPVGIESRLGTRQPTYTTPDVEIKKEIPPPERRAGWMQGNTYADNDGNWWSADFDHEHWNTPAGVNEAISIWGRPMGTRHSWETPAAIKSQYTHRQKPDFSWMNKYD
jgi:hypothetical protein